jgi:hypothetical protein|tara:strand:+ start:220 stop:1362 length:1143 start_codon:yes stop_codon:yes gene_type:complete
VKNIVLDTNILHQEGLLSGKMQVLKKLVDAELIAIFVPDIVLREFSTKRVTEITNSLNSIQGNFAKTQKKLDHSTELKKRSAAIEKEIVELKKIVEKSVSEDVKYWLDSHKVKVLPFNIENIKKVIDDYFTGAGVFKALKSREDFPDSMVHQTIIDLVESVGEVYAVLIDRAFQKGIEKQDGVVVLNSLKALFELDEIADYLANTPFEEMFTSHSVAEQLQRYFAHQKELISHIFVSDEGIHNTELIGINAYNATIDWPDENDIRNILISNVYSVSEGEFTADISFVTDTTVHYVSDYGSYLQVERDANRNVDLDSMNGDGFCDLYERFTVELSGKIHFTFSERNSIEEATKVMNSLIEYEAKVAIDLEIDSATLLDIIG